MAYILCFCLSLQPNLPNAIGASKSQTMVPMSRPTLEFEGNTAHSSGYWWVSGGETSGACARFEQFYDEQS
jgi:hypothetical protein